MTGRLPIDGPGFGGGGGIHDGSGMENGNIFDRVMLAEDGGGSDYNPPEECNNHDNGGGDEQEQRELNAAILEIFRTVTGEADGGFGPPNPLLAPSGRDYTEVEFGALVVQNSDGTFGAHNNNFFTSDRPNFVAISAPSDATSVQGIWHNHPSSGNVSGSSGNYPSSGTDGRGDWNALQAIKDRFGANDPSFDPAIWITGPDGETREFRLSDRAMFESLTDAEIDAGVGLEGTELEVTDATEAC